MNELSEGARVNSVRFGVESAVISVGPKSGIAEMIVSMQEGSGGLVPWVRVHMDGGKIIKLINCEKLAVVELAPIIQPTEES